jgi:SSS family solute:Na+ symporter
VSRLVSLVVKAGAVVVILVLDPQFSIDLQLIGGVIIVQTLPAIVIGLYTRALHAWGLLAGWACGMAAGLYMLYDTPNPTTGKAHFGGAQYLLSKLHIGDGKTTVYTGILALALNLIVAIVVSLLLRGRRGRGFEDRTTPEDYEVEAGDPGVKDIEPTEPEPAVTAGR